MVIVDRWWWSGVVVARVVGRSGGQVRFRHRRRSHLSYICDGLSTAWQILGLVVGSSFFLETKKTKRIVLVILGAPLVYLPT